MKRSDRLPSVGRFAFTLIELMVVLGLIAVLAALLLPTLGAAAGTAHRAACAHNLDKIGAAIESYLSQHGDYYPGALSWKPWHVGAERIGSRYFACLSNKEIFRTQQPHKGIWESVYLLNVNNPNTANNSWPELEFYTQQNLADSALIGWCGAWGSGRTAGGLGPTYLPFPPRDNVSLKVVPWGLGWLMYTDLLAHPQDMYCPAAMDQGFQHTATSGPYPNEDTGRLVRHIKNEDPSVGSDTKGPQDTLREWRAAGPLQPSTLTHGNWPRHRFKHSYSGYAVYSQYVYRNNPIVYCDAKANILSGPPTGTGTGEPFDNLTVAFTNPKVVSEHMCPAFKTPNQLGSRALVADQWHKRNAIADPGFGIQAHRDGYNVLYGDYTTKWYGDPEQRIIYWEGYPDTTNLLNQNPLCPNNMYYQVGLGTNFWYWGGHSGAYYASNVDCAMAMLYLDPLIWHNLDAFNGVDTDVDVPGWRTELKPW